MSFRPCIDIHNGKVKQIVGSSLEDSGSVTENFVSDRDSAYYARLYKEHGLKGGHVIILNGQGSEYRKASEEAAFAALEAYPEGLQVGGGVDDKNAMTYVNHGASHVIVTSFVFEDNELCKPKMERLAKAVGKNRVVIDLSCVKTEDGYMVACNRWQTITKIKLDTNLAGELSKYCDEYLIHAVDVEGKQGGIDEALVEMLGKWDICPVTYAGGIRNLDDVRKIEEIGRGRVNYTIGSALDIFGGSLSFESVVSMK